MEKKAEGSYAEGRREEDLTCLFHSSQVAFAASATAFKATDNYTADNFSF
ncbi:MULTISPECIES: hypothetical protein [Fischerella]|nr:hypothetical protein [Fischerella muscicola]